MAGATVSLTGRPAGPDDTLLQGSGTTQTDAYGAFVFTQLPVGTYSLEAQAGDDVSSTVRTRLTESSNPVTLVLHHGAALTVLVDSLEDGKPVLGATVRLGAGDPALGSPAIYRAQKTDANGKTVFHGVHATANHPIYAEAEGYTPDFLAFRTGSASQSSDWLATLHLGRGGTLEGTVVDSAGNPVAAASVLFAPSVILAFQDTSELFDLSPPRGSGLIKRTDASGHFSIPAPPKQGCVLATPAQGGAGRACGITPQVGKTIQVGTIQLNDGAELSGTVLQEGRPVPGAQVLLTIAGYAYIPDLSHTYRFQTTTDMSGAFHFLGVEKRAIEVFASTAQGSSDLVSVDLSDGSKSGVTVEIKQTGTITGDVVDAAGNPSSGAIVTYYYQVPPDADMAVVPVGKVSIRMPRERARPNSTNSVTADDQGHFEIAGLAPGSYSLSAREAESSGVPTDLGGVGQLNVHLGDHVELTLRRRHVVTGRIVFADGTPVSDLRVAFSKPDATEFLPDQTATIRGGQFVLADVPDGTYDLELRGLDFVKHRLPQLVRVSNADVDLGTITVERAAERDGQVVDAAGNPVFNARVDIWYAPTIWGSATSDGDGKFKIPGVQIGQPLRLRASTGDVATDWQKFGPDEAIVIKLDPAQTFGTLVGKLIDPSGAPVSGRLILFTTSGLGPPGKDLPSLAQAYTTEDGMFRFDKVPAIAGELWTHRLPPDSNTERAPWATVNTRVLPGQTRNLQLNTGLQPPSGPR